MCVYSSCCGGEGRKTQPIAHHQLNGDSTMRGITATPGASSWLSSPGVAGVRLIPMTSNHRPRSRWSGASFDSVAPCDTSALISRSSKRRNDSPMTQVFQRRHSWKCTSGRERPIRAVGTFAPIAFVDEQVQDERRTMRARIRGRRLRSSQRHRAGHEMRPFDRYSGFQSLVLYVTSTGVPFIILCIIAVRQRTALLLFCALVAVSILSRLIYSTLSRSFMRRTNGIADTWHFMLASFHLLTPSWSFLILSTWGFLAAVISGIDTYSPISEFEIPLLTTIVSIVSIPKMRDIGIHLAATFERRRLMLNRCTPSPKRAVKRYGILDHLVTVLIGLPLTQRFGTEIASSIDEWYPRNFFRRSPSLPGSRFGGIHYAIILCIGLFTLAPTVLLELASDVLLFPTSDTEAIIAG